MAISTDQARPWIDTTEFTRTGGRLSGHWPVAGLERLTDLLADTTGTIDWTLEGDRSVRPDGGHDAHLVLGFRGLLQMVCVRCLEAVAAPIADRRPFKLVVAESIAEREDQQTEAFDLLVASPHLDVLDLLEDEIIMALPLAPRHAQCQPPPGAPVVPEGATDRGAAPGSSDADAPPAGKRPNPFAALAQLRSRPVDGDDEN